MAQGESFQWGTPMSQAGFKKSGKTCTSDYTSISSCTLWKVNADVYVVSLSLKWKLSHTAMKSQLEPLFDCILLKKSAVAHV